MVDSLPENEFLKYHPDTLTYVRTQYNFEKPGAMDRAIDSLEEWLKKQNHFTVREFSRDFLERQIILDKGSLERTKKQMDCLFTMKSIPNSFFLRYDLKYLVSEEGIKTAYIHTVVPKLTKEHRRVYVAKMLNADFDPQFLTKLYSFGINALEHLRKNDYCMGFEAVMDFRDLSMIELVSKINLSELKRYVEFVMDGYHMRIRAFHFLTSSKAVELLLSVARQVFSAKMKDRLIVHSNVETLHEAVPKEFLPEEFGGNLGSLHKLCGTSSSTSDRQLEETVNLEERTSTSISQVPAHTSTSTSPTPSEPIVNQPATEPDVRFCENVANDPALWPQVIPDNLRLFLTERGPIQLKKKPTILQIVT